jgi:peptidoglycan/LPS O-acetylase OafA/YrhL
VVAGEVVTADARGGGHRVAAFDGVRGVAIIAVLLYHGGVSWAAGGFLGVDVFFVLSGYLITSQLVREVASTGSLRLDKFWTRRVRRLVPAAFLVIAAVAAWIRFVGPIGGTDIRGDVAAALGFVSNWKFIAAQTDYFARTATASPLQHTWSLAVEAQFYVLWPLLVIAAMRAAGRSHVRYAHHAHRPSEARPPEFAVAVVAGVGVVASAALMALLYHPASDPTRVYFGTDTRVQAILVGAFIAAIIAAGNPGEHGHVWSKATRVTVEVVAAAAALGICVAIWAFDGNSTSLYRGGFAMVAALTAIVLAALVLLPDGVVGRALSFPPLVGIGKISYGVYLWHWPVFLILTRARTGLHGWPLFGLRAAATLECSLISWMLVERPILERKRGEPQPWRRALVPVGAATAIAALSLSPAVGATTTSTEGGSALSVAAKDAPKVDPNLVPLAPSSRPKRPFGQPARIELIGDSVALTLADGLTPLASRYGARIVNSGILGCGISVGGPYRYFGAVNEQRKECDLWQRTWVAKVAQADADVVAVLVGRWEVMDRVVNGQWRRIGDPVFDNVVRTQIEQAYRAASIRGATVAFLTAPYYLRGERPDGGRWPEDDPARVNRFNQLLREVAAKHPGRVRLIDFGKKTGPNGVYTRVVSGVGLRSDGVHFTAQGARWLAPWLMPQLAALAPPTLPGPPTTLSPYRRTTPTSVGRSQGATTAPDALVR